MVEISWYFQYFQRFQFVAYIFHDLSLTESGRNRFRISNMSSDVWRFDSTSSLSSLLEIWLRYHWISTKFIAFFYFNTFSMIYRWQNQVGTDSELVTCPVMCGALILPPHCHHYLRYGWDIIGFPQTFDVIYVRISSFSWNRLNTIAGVVSLHSASNFFYINVSRIVFWFFIRSHDPNLKGRMT